MMSRRTQIPKQWIDKGGNSNNNNSNQSSNSDKNNSSSKKNEELTSEDMLRYSVVGNEKVEYTSNGGYSVVIKNSIQGPKCFDAFNVVLGDYTIGRTYNILR